MIIRSINVVPIAHTVQTSFPARRPPELTHPHQPPVDGSGYQHDASPGRTLACHYPGQYS